jgi:hypothetical protein
MVKALERSHAAVIDLLAADMPDLKKLLKIGELAKLSGVPVSTLRHWISQGKLSPIARTQSDYMLFSPEQIAEVKKIAGNRNH